jgi:hypothetical protein
MLNYTDFKTVVYEDIQKGLTGNTYGKHKRYILSLTNNTISLNELTLNGLESIINDIKQTVNRLNLNSYCVGFWLNKNVIYLDLNISSNSKNIALKLASVFNQKAIFDSKTQTEIFV